MQSTERLIKNAEARWQEQLQAHCQDVFKQTHLPSHDHTHHARVWIQAKELLAQLAKNNISFNERDVEKLMIACYFHDTGMSVTIQKDHGKISRRIAKDFLKDKDLHAAELEEILDAIENHDKKDYKSPIGDKPGFPLQSLLNISDDLDALSFVGSYRYTEIYLLRNTPLKEIPDAVLENLQNRFQHMKTFLSFSPAYLRGQNLRYMATRNFFKDLSFQIKQVGDELTSLNGPLGIVNFIKEFIFTQKMDASATCKNAILIAGDFYVTNFFEKLEKEL
ncbi:MAG TPA: HD domain-containing protein [Bacteroidales bacterium]|nr:HD domain-containing protein [Bacteroidales bacterium]